MPDTWSLRLDADGRLTLTEATGVVHANVRAVRAFPLSAPEEGVSLSDRTGRELLWLPRLDALAPAQREPLEAYLANREFVPKILRIVSVSAAVEPSEWNIETDRGRTRLLLKSEDDVFHLDERAILVIDAHGIRYLIPNLADLDATSRRLIERFR